ncbi:MAG: hypothetical protein SZ59_C0003G0032 [candidate division TM6 bacterium GW2011_GWF2_28_16]|nr:MAG: hypothetical protein SZ59_C0003G0032 [candidate division TM6 bacterium GW2011_GWF2_28_16]
MQNYNKIINNKIFKYLIIFFINYLNLNSLYSMQYLKGYIQTEQDLKSTPQIKVLFNGKEVTSDENGFYSIPLDHSFNNNFNKYYFLACKEIKQNVDKKNTIKYLSIPNNFNYKLYSCLKNNVTGKFELTEEKLIHKDKIIPNNCIITLINPNFIEKIETWNINLNNNFIALPKIKLVSNRTSQKIYRQSDKSLAKSLDCKPFHEEVTIEEKIVNPKVKLVINK